MKESISRPDAATGTTTAKQEKYEKKMAKYLANKARKLMMEKVQKENEKKMNSEQKEIEYFKSIRGLDFQSLKEVEKVFVRYARCFYKYKLKFIHFPIIYKGNLNMIAAVRWGQNAKKVEITDLTIGSIERNELDELWDRVMDRELDNHCIELVLSGKHKFYNPEYIKADSPEEAFDIACKEYNVEIVFKAA